MAKWIDLADILTPEGYDALQVGHLMVFDFEGSRNEYKVMRKRHGKMWVKPVVTYTVQEAQDKGLVGEVTEVVSNGASK